MKKRNFGFKQKSVFFIVAAIIFAIVGYTVYGIMDKRSEYMRFGIDIKCGVSATFRAEQDGDESFVPTDDQLDAAKAVIELRMDDKNILDRTVSVDSENKSILVEFPWQANEKNYDPVAAIREFGETALLTFVVVEDAEKDDEGAIPHEEYDITKYYTIKSKIMDGSVIENAGSMFYNGQHVVTLEFDDKGTASFASVTKEVANVNNTHIGIMLDDILFSVASVQEAITDGNAMITSSTFDATTSKELADKINSGALPFAMESTNYSSVSATMGSHALKIMLLAGIIALVIIVLFMTIHYRLPGFVASITLLLQTAGQLLIFHSLNLTLTLPGIAGIILSIGMG
ncbi:MAG: protein translocase subunit SecD, partial [Clostridia bacterium]|nr:protein translocase subunit SecD [Clostridia bacterium]